MKKEEAINRLWYNMGVASRLVKEKLVDFEQARRQKNADKAGEEIKGILREVIEIYSRLAVIAALEEIS